MSSWPNTVTLGGICLDQDIPGSLRIVEQVIGWDDGPSVLSGLTPRSQQDGARDGTGFSGTRIIDLAGFVGGGDAQAVKDALTALRPQRAFGLLVSNTAVGNRAATVRVTIAAKFVWLDDTSFGWTMQVTAPDPLKYGPPTGGTATLATATPGAGLVYPLTYPWSWGVAAGATPGAVAVPNDGTAPYWPTLHLAGPVTNPIITLSESGAWIRYGAALNSAQWLDINCADRTVLLQGQISVRSKITSSGDWLSIPVGGATITFGATDANPAASLAVSAFEGAYI